MADSKEVIQQRLLSNISDGYDKSEGSFFYDIEKPISIEIEKAYIELESILNKGFADTATGNDLDRIVYEQGINRKLSTKAKGEVVVTGLVGAVISKGEMVASDNVNFIFLEDKVIPTEKTINVSVECEQYGIIGNVPVGAIKYFPKTLEGLQTVTNIATFTNGYEEETDESLRERYYTKIQTPATSGNKWHYLNWSKEVTGVGDARVFPLANGPGTVKVVIINSNKREADTGLINEVYTHIEEVRPIGATVIVESATEKVINISVILVIDTNNYTEEAVKSSIEDNLVIYFKSIAFKESYVSYAKIGNIIFDTPGVLDYSNLQVNNGTANISIEDIKVAVLGGVTLG
ncbi:baseplate J protein [Clostridium sulfidigenes]|uniref:Baseplate J protein n=1 Tax=Clostridium sulfidigenes TaxID=318464 RepID=A0A084J9A9_9CLOT|nr:baseplate J/gp47 family protein [Clostridium sulfidigenes]KEZ85543.1 baseplate J protein [Clostridium sulfidigenes]